jgi:hypothetical protein
MVTLENMINERRVLNTDSEDFLNRFKPILQQAEGYGKRNKEYLDANTNDEDIRNMDSLSESEKEQYSSARFNRTTLSGRSNEYLNTLKSQIGEVLQDGYHNNKEKLIYATMGIFNPETNAEGYNGVKQDIGKYITFKNIEAGLNSEKPKEKEKATKIGSQIYISLLDEKLRENGMPDEERNQNLASAHFLYGINQKNMEVAAGGALVGIGRQRAQDKVNAIPENELTGYIKSNLREDEEYLKFIDFASSYQN